MRVEPITDKLSLTNDGKLELVYFGVGTMFTESLGHTNFVLIKGDTHIVVDFGRTAPEQWKNLTGLPITDIETILPTHSHSDHIGGLEQLAFANRYIGQPFMGKNKLDMIITPEYERILWDYSMRGGLAYSEAGILNLRDFFNVTFPKWYTYAPRETWTINYKGIDIELFRTNHVPDAAPEWQEAFISYGMVVDNHVFISVDTKFDKNLVESYAPKVEHMFHDVQFFPGAVHAPLEDLCTFDTRIKNKMYLMHYADNFEEHTKTIQEQNFAGWTQSGVRYIFD